jgi:ADP-ribose pyrophosphatase YjhB (NUDIX family)
MPIPDFVLELRRLVGTTELWLSGVTAVVRRGEHLLLVRRRDNGQWSPVTGIIDPGEEPAVCAAREAMEETGVEIRVDRLASVGSGAVVSYPNGDRARYLDLTFACTWLAGEPYAADDESLDARWWPLAELPPMAPVILERIEAALSGEQPARFKVD